MLRTQVSLHDILDVEAFVVMCIKRSGAQVKPSEFEDMIAEGICILYAMSERYNPHMEGYVRPGRFSGYAVKYLPRKMKEAWHRSHEEHLHRTQPDGRRRYEYYAKPMCYEPSVDLDEQTLRVPGEFIPPLRHDVMEGQSTND